MIAALIAAIAAVTSAVVSSHSNKSVAQLQAYYIKEKESIEFIKEQLSKLYYPVSLHLKATNHLFKRYSEATTSEEEIKIIEHAMKDHNQEILRLLIDGAMYLDPDAPKEVTTELLEHFIQWNTVYKMKYTDKTYGGPVFAGIKQFGFRGFPKGREIYFNDKTKEEGIDGYFNDKTKELRDKLYKAYKDRIND